MLQPIKPIDQMWVKGLIYGESGRGKTYLLGTAQDDPRTAPMAFLDFEGNIETLAGLDIDVYTIRSWDEFGEAYRILLDNKPGYRSVGIDSITEVNLWALMNVLKKKAHEVSREGKNRDMGPFGEPDQAFQSDYGDVLIQMRRFIRRFRDLPMHIFYTALVDTTIRPREGTVRIPQMLGAMKQEVDAMVNFEGCLVFEEYKDEQGLKAQRRQLLLHDIPGYQLKVRTPWRTAISDIPDTMADPTVTKLLDAILPSQSATRN